MGLFKKNMTGTVKTTYGLHDVILTITLKGQTRGSSHKDTRRF